MNKKFDLFNFDIGSSDNSDHSPLGIAVNDDPEEIKKDMENKDSRWNKHYIDKDGVWYEVKDPWWVWVFFIGFIAFFLFSIIILTN